MLGALGLAGAALIADQFVTSAGASEGTAQVAVDAAAAPVEETTASPAAAGATLADRFGAYRESTDAEHAGLSKAFSAVSAEERIQPAESGQQRAEEVGIRLTAILRRSEGHIAVINGRPLRVGQSIEGARVISIRDREVELESSVGPITLRLTTPSLDGG